jgi:hypothetical protein
MVRRARIRRRDVGELACRGRRPDARRAPVADGIGSWRVGRRPNSHAMTRSRRRRLPEVGAEHEAVDVRRVPIQSSRPDRAGPRRRPGSPGCPVAQGGPAGRAGRGRRSTCWPARFASSSNVCACAAAEHRDLERDDAAHHEDLTWYSSPAPFPEPNQRPSRACIVCRRPRFSPFLSSLLPRSRALRRPPRCSAPFVVLVKGNAGREPAPELLGAAPTPTRARLMAALFAGPRPTALRRPRLAAVARDDARPREGRRLRVTVGRSSTGALRALGRTTHGHRGAPQASSYCCRSEFARSISGKPAPAAATSRSTPTSPPTRPTSSSPESSRVPTRSAVRRVEARASPPAASRASPSSCPSPTAGSTTRRSEAGRRSAASPTASSRTSSTPRRSTSTSTTTSGTPAPTSS